MNVPTCKWKDINIEFIVGFSRKLRQNNSIWVVLYRLTKHAQFIPVKSTYSAEEYAKLYLEKIVSLHGIPLSIILDRGTQLSSCFWRSFLKGLGTQLIVSTAIHHQTYGQEDCTIQTLENMLSAYVTDFEGNLYDHLSLIEFCYNNSYH